MADDKAELVVGLMRKRGLQLTEGFSEAELADLEKEYGFTFPPDYRCFLRTAVPVSDGFADWRSQQDVAKRMSWPLEGIIFDIEHNGFWYGRWGTRPDTSEERYEKVLRHVSEYPRLIPVYSHRYIPDSPQKAGNPVFSVYQTDIIYYGSDLFSYFACEFGLGYDGANGVEPRHIEFWSDLAG